jgi:hypothetical protein
MVCCNGKLSNYDKDNKSFLTAFYSTQTSTIYLDTRIKELYIIFQLRYSRVDSLSIAQISQHGKETSFLGAPSDY